MKSKIYAWKALNRNMSGEEFEYVFNVACKAALAGT
jgi:hypothetical protein